MAHDDNPICPVAYLDYQELDVVEKSLEEKNLDLEVMEKLIEARKDFAIDHLVNQEESKYDQLLLKNAKSDNTVIEKKFSLSVSILNP